MSAALAFVALIAGAALTLGVAVARDVRRPLPVREADRIETLNCAVMLWAIRQRESGDNPLAVGSLGERSAYQFTAPTWRRYTVAPFTRATTDLTLAGTIARAHLGTILATLARRGLDAEPEFIAAAWNYGPNFPVHAARSEYARAVAALYWDRLDGGKGAQ